jgi:hypothetical protein
LCLDEYCLIPASLSTGVKNPGTEDSALGYPWRKIVFT